MNPTLPRNTKQKGGYAFNSTQPQQFVSSFSSLPQATSSKVSSLKTYMQLADSAYCSNVCPNAQWNCKNCIPNYTLVRSFLIGNLDINGYIARNDQTKEIELVFRGTHSPSNWIADITFQKVPYTPVAGASVHIGFYAAYTSAQSTVVPAVLDQLTKYPSYRVVVSGHSLGGALATLATLDLYQRDGRLSNQNLFAKTYGGPRVGDANFAYYFSSTGISLERTVHNRDLVPHLPPQMNGYLHPGVEYWIAKDQDNVSICNTSLDSSSCSNSIVPFTDISDHIE
ncbi:Alpha/Beta hydrolase protein [Spinellus fusiger]|nr:Alpha/Beta hydrolase protein [Spinellus fusiger]